MSLALWAGQVGWSAQSSAGASALSLFLMLLGAVTAALAVGVRAAASEGLAGRVRWGVLGLILVCQALDPMAGAVSTQMRAWASVLAWSGSVWLVAATSSGRGMTWVVACELALSWLCGLLAAGHAGMGTWAVMGLFAMLRLLSSGNFGRRAVYRAVLLLAVAEILLAFAVPDLVADQPPGWRQALASGLPPVIAVAAAWPVAITWSWRLPMRITRVLAPTMARLLAPVAVIAALSRGEPILALIALAVGGLHALLLACHLRRWQAVVPDLACGTLPSASAVRAHLIQVLGEDGRSDSTCTVLMVDLDRFAAFARHHGAARSEAVLAQVGAALQAGLMRSGDRVARWRANTFLVVLPDTAETQAPVVARRLLSAIAALGIVHPDQAAGVLGASIGAASREAWAVLPAHRLLREAGEALQRAKGDGRGRFDSAADVLLHSGAASPAAA